MQHRHDDEARAIALDACLDRMVSGDDWQEVLPSDGEEQREALSLVAVARRLVETASLAQSPGAELKQRVWQRVSASPEFATNGFFRRLGGLRVLYTPPARPGVVQKVLFYRMPALPPIFVRFAEAG